MYVNLDFFSGLGYGMIAISGMVALYYTVIIGWCILYLFISFTAVLPWEDCHSDWATKGKDLFNSR